MKKWISISVIALLVLGGGLWFYQSKQTTTTASAEVLTTQVQKGDLEVSISGSGSIASINSTDVTSSVDAIVDEVLVAVNDVVAAGDELVTFEDGSDPITAAHAGTITTLEIVSGDRVQSGSVVGHITDYTTLQTVITVDELDITSVKVGQAAEIKASAFPDATYTGKVTSVAKEGTAENGVSSFEVTIQFDDPKELLIGMSTEVSITTESKSGVLYVPIESVKTDGGQKYVTVQTSEATDSEEATTTKQVVETGINDEKNIEIVSGLKEGQIVQLALTVSTGSSTSGFGGRGAMQGGFPSDGGMPAGRMMGGTGTGKGGE